MGTTYVTMSRDIDHAPGFWMRDGLLELWLRLLALHLPEPNNNGEHQATLGARNQWLLASRGYFNGCVPHGLKDICATPEGRAVVRLAIDSLLAALNRSPAPLDPHTMNLLGMDGDWEGPIERQRLKDIGQAFIDLIEGKITRADHDCKVMPGLTPYDLEKINRGEG